MNQSKPELTSRDSKQESWKRHIENWKESSLTQKQYCIQHQLKLATFQYWKSKLERHSLTKPLLPVTVKPTVSSTMRSFPSGISLSFDERFSIHLEVCFNQDTLLSVLDLLESR
jgi:hypothetical protein